MKLVITQTCVGAGGRILDRGTIHDTRAENKEDDREAYLLISSGRALQAETAEAKQFLAEFASTKEADPASGGKKK